MAFKTIIAGIQDKSGVTIDLLYDSLECKVREIKTFDNGSVTTITVDIEDWDPDWYGEQGEEFLKKIEIVW
ncbi:MAG: hypothetical protein DRO67_04870 [Candidatus Asgardarchaeum californiense]|nr:MAG: hypothetical protein DRO67_04870 [Candidatus Asgardarchaeum californiense]